MMHIVKLILLLLALFLLPPSPDMVVASAEGGHGAEAKKGEKSEKKGEKKEAGKAENGVIEIGPLVVNVLSNKGYKYFRLGMEVQCEDNSTAERLVKPDAKEDLVFLLSGKLAEDLLTQSGKMVLRRELVDLFDKYAGSGKVKNLYFTEFVFQ